jgi:hypothetical protein
LIVGYHAPAPGSHSGIADYAQTLKQALGRFVCLKECSNDRDNAADIHLYHLGNNRLHEHIYNRALKTPGVIVLHDAVLHHFMLGTLTHDQYIAEWIYNYGEWQRDLGEELWRSRSRSAFDARYFEFPMLRRILERSRAVIVHNPGAAAIARTEGATNLTIIPHFCEFSDGAPSVPELVRFREGLGFAAGDTLFGIFGYLREPKRVLACVGAFKRLHTLRPKTALLLSGQCVSPDLDRILEIEARHPAIRRLGRLCDADFALASSAVDCCLNLRYPGVGETSGIAIRLMGYGKPVLVTDNVENSAFPETAVLRIAPGVAESADLFEHIGLVTDFPQIGREIGSEAQFHVREHHALEPVARKYWETLCAAAI